jgi:GNAT superfamily N-acetyltransferase
MIREASVEDIPQMIALAEMKRSEYEQYAPTFWRNAKDAVQKQAPFFRAQLSQEDTICLVAEHEGDVTGFIIAKVVPAPPVYDPGSLVCMIDDFVVASPNQWGHTGKDLLEEVRHRAKSRGASLTVVVCGHLDEAKREMLRAADLYIASEWYVSG